MLGIAGRNFVLQFSRYRVLLAALSLGALVFIVLFGVTASLTQTVHQKAARYFSGDIMVLGFRSDRTPQIEDEAQIWQAAQSLVPQAVAKHRRSVYYETDARLVFNGQSLPQRRVIGVDFSFEAESFRSLEFIEGRAPDAKGEANGLWVSQDTAQRLQFHVDDEVTLLVQTAQGFKNTLSLRVAGIFQETSFFGFASYLDYRTLNSALGRSEGMVTEVGLTFPPGFDAVKAASEWSEAMRTTLSLAPPRGTPDETLDWVNDHPQTDATYAVYSLNGRLKQIQDIINAINAVNSLLSVVFLFIVAIGVYNTYQMIAFERVREVGTMRALGMQRSAVVRLFLYEAMLLAGFGTLLGLVLGSLALAGVCSLDFRENLMADMFLSRGHVVWIWPWQGMLGVLGIMWLTAILGALWPAWKVSRVRPVEALRHEG